MQYYSVLVDLPRQAGDCFTYAFDGDIQTGERVLVELGRRKTVGYVAGPADPMPEARSISARVDEYPVVTEEVLRLTKWMSDKYLASWFRCVEAALPGALKRNSKSKGAKFRSVLSCNMTGAEIAQKFSSTNATATDERMYSALVFLLEYPATMTVAELGRRFELTRGRLDTLIKNKKITKQQVKVQRDPMKDCGGLSDHEGIVSLNTEQKKAFDQIFVTPESSAADVHEVLIVGVTGSGKTEVYLQSISKVLGEGKSAIVLVPEISLTPQAVDRFRSRFGDTVAILHSQLSVGERYDEWMRLKNEKAKVVVGARSAIFAPLKNIGLIVIDEAHEASYKQGESPRYHAVDVARERARLTGARLVLGTATPTCELTKSDAIEVKITSRIQGRPLPEVTVVDMRKELAQGNRSIFSDELSSALKKTLERKEQALLFLNRRGHASFVLCRSCGEAVSCPRCDVTLTLHKSVAKRVGGALLVCHFCNHREEEPRVCSQCGSKAIRSFGAGTEKIAQEVQKKFPHARVVRMDADTTVRKGAHREILNAFIKGKYDVLVGTQMIGKGLDFPGITLVGVVAADSSLHLPDFRAAERTFNLLVQVMGRAGRAEKKGRAIVQTYNPDHYAIKYASKHAVDEFVKTEMKVRQSANMPPFKRMIQWTFESENSELIREIALQAADSIHQLPGQFLGPAPAPIERLRGRTRWQLRWLLDDEIDSQSIDEAAAIVAKLKKKNVRIVLDVDPFDLL